MLMIESADEVLHVRAVAAVTPERGRGTSVDNDVRDLRAALPCNARTRCVPVGPRSTTWLADTEVPLETPARSSATRAVTDNVAAVVFVSTVAGATVRANSCGAVVSPAPV